MLMNLECPNAQSKWNVVRMSRRLIWPCWPCQGHAGLDLPPYSRYGDVALTVQAWRKLSRATYQPRSWLGLHVCPRMDQETHTWAYVSLIHECVTPALRKSKTPTHCNTTMTGQSYKVGARYTTVGPCWRSTGIGGPTAPTLTHEQKIRNFDMRELSEDKIVIVWP